MKQPNDGGGTTLILAEGDDLDAVPDSHRDIVTDSVRAAFRDPIAYFSDAAGQTEIENLQLYLRNFTSGGRWSLLLADTYMMDRDTIAAFHWFHAGQYPCMFGTARCDCDDDRFASFYDDFSLAHWDSIGFAGGIIPLSNHITVDDFGIESPSSVFPPNSTTVFGSSSCGDMMVCNERGDAGYMSHENGQAYDVGSFPEMLNWIFGELVQNRTPEFDYSRCR